MSKVAVIYYAGKGITLTAESVKCNNTLDNDGLVACRALGTSIA